MAAAQQVENLEDSFLRRHIQPGQRIVHQEQLGFLRQRAGNEHPLLLTAGQFADLPVGKVGRTHQREGITHQVAIAVARLPQQTNARDAAHQHHIAHRHRELPIHLGALRDVTDADVAACAVTVDRDLAGARLQDARNDLEESALARTVRPDNGDALPAPKLEAHVIERGRRALIPDGDVGEVDDRPILRMHDMRADEGFQHRCTCYFSAATMACTL